MPRSVAIQSHTIYISQIIALVLAIVTPLSIWLLSIPPVIQALLFSFEVGCCLTLARFAAVVRFAGHMEAAVERGMARTRQGGRISRWLLRPALAFADLGTTLTGGIADPVIKTAAQISLWLVFGTISLVILVYIGLAVAVLVFCLMVAWVTIWLLFELRKPQSSLRPGQRVKFSRQGDGTHMEAEGIFMDRDLGKVKKKRAGEFEVREMFGHPIKLKENRTMFGSQDPKHPFDLTMEDGTEGRLKKRWDDQLEFETKREKKEKE